MTTPAIIDAIAVAVLASFGIYGVWKGLLRTLAGLLVVVLSLVGAGIVASALSAPAAKLVVPILEKRIESRLDEAVREQRPEPSPGESLPLEELLDLLGVDQARREALTERAEKNVRDTGATLAAALIESLAQSVLYGLLYILSFLLLSLALHLLVRMLDAVLKLPGLHGLNAVGGGLVGLAEGALLLFLAVWALRLVGVSFDAGEESRIFRFFTDYTPLDALKFLGI